MNTERPIKLPAKREAYCQAYVRLDNKSEAYREAGFSTKNATKKTINEAASRLHSNSNVLARIDQLRKKVEVIAEKKFNITTETMLRHLDILRNARIDQFVRLTYERVDSGDKDDNGEIIYNEVPRVIFKPFDELTPEQLMCIESIKETRYGIELKLHGKEWTIEKINKHIGFYEKDNQQKAGDLNADEKKLLLAKILEKAKK